MDRSTIRLVAHAVLWGAATLVAFGLVSAIIPNPVFGREISPEPVSIVVWLLSAPLAGLVLATYTAGMPTTTSRPLPVGTALAGGGAAIVDPERGSTLGMVGGVAAFLAIGCPVCNKLVLVALGTSGALTIWAPLQPLIGAASIVLLAATAVWRLRIRARGGACLTS
jgi:hypothetical protein